MLQPKGKGQNEHTTCNGAERLREHDIGSDATGKNKNNEGFKLDDLKEVFYGIKRSKRYAWHGANKTISHLWENEEALFVS